jgi:DNA polymerase-1
MKVPLYLIDGYSLIYRSYFAFIRRPLVDAEGRNTSAIFGFFRSLFQLLRLREPRALAVVMDSRTPTVRHQRYEQYKANREKAPEDLHEQVPAIEEILGALGIACLRMDGYEADDLIATLARRCQAEGRECYVLSGDKDILQLVGEGVSVILPPKGAEEFGSLDRAAVYAARGVYPEQIVDYLSLTGDSSDNVPGVSGIGDKTAVKLLSQYGDLDSLYSRLDSIQPESLRRKLAAGRDSAYLSRELVTLHADLPLAESPGSLELGKLERQKAAALFARRGMNSLVREIAGEPPAAGVSGSPAQPSAESAEARSAGPGEQGLKHLQSGAYQSVLEVPVLERWIAEARRLRVFAFDTETEGLDPLGSPPVGFSLATAAGRACYIPVRACDAQVLPLEGVLAALRTLLEDPALTLIGQNIKFDYKVMAALGIRPACRLFDTMVAAWLLDSDRASFSLDNLALQLLGYRTIHYEEVVGKEPGRTLADVPLARATDYSGEDADIAYQLYELLRPPLEAEGLQGVLDKLEMPLVPVLAEMELAGIRLDVAAIEAYGGELEGELSRLEQQIFTLCGHPFNVRSTRELQSVLFDELGLAPVKKTKTGQSTDNFVLMELARAGQPVPELVLSHRLLSKLKSTYVDALPRLVHPSTGRLHTHYVQTGAATGRLASRDPNLQNIPVREESGRRIRGAFIPRQGWRFLSADYAQIELVVLAHMSGDPMLAEAFRQQRDVHRQTAAVLFGVPEQEVSAEQRRIGKTINFGVIYGMSAFRLSRDLRIPRREAEEFIRRYFRRYARVDEFIRQTIGEARERGYVQTIMGRRRRLGTINSRNRTEQMAAERVAVNSPIQGSAADIVKRAMIDVARAIAARGLKTRLLLQVHDELIFEVPEAELETAPAVVREAMEKAVTLSVPLRVSLETGRTWGEIH